MFSFRKQKNDGALSRDAQVAIRRQSSHLNISLGIGGVFVVLFYFYIYVINGVNPVGILGVNSLGRPGVLFGSLLVAGLFAWKFWETADLKISPHRISRYFNTVILSFAAGIIGFTLLGLFVVTMNSAFQGLKFDIITASLIFGGAIAVTAYVTISFAASLTISRIYSMLVVVLFGGILISAMVTQDSDWYNTYLSALGMSTAGGIAKLFNFSLIFAGVMLIAMSNVLFDSARSFYVNNPLVGSTRYSILHLCFILSGVFLAGIGLFPFVENTTQGSIHMLSAALLGVVFVLWMAGLRWLIPFFDHSFYKFSWVTAIAIAAIYVLSTAGIYFNTTGLELSVFVIATAWLSLYLANMFNATLENSKA